MHYKGCPRCGSDWHNVSNCPLPGFMMVFAVVGAAIAACIMNVVGLKP
jgi:hypothetical protein